MTSVVEIFRYYLFSDLFLYQQLPLVSPQKAASYIGKCERPLHDCIVIPRLEIKSGAFELSVKNKRFCYGCAS